MMKTKQNNEVIHHTSAVYIANETELSWLINQVWFVTKSRHNKDVIEQKGVVYAENHIELSWLIESGVIWTR